MVTLRDLRRLWGVFIIILAIGYLKTIFPFPADAAAEVLASIIEIEGAKDVSEIQQFRTRLESEFRNNLVIGLIMITCGLVSGCILIKKHVSKAQILTACVTAALFVFVYVTYHLIPDDGSAIFAMIAQKSELFLSLIRVGGSISRINAIHELLAPSAYFLTFVGCLVWVMLRSSKN